MINPHRIRYNNIFSNELNIPDLIMCVAMESDNGETPSFLNREAVFSEAHDGRYKRIHRFKYTETFAPKFTFFKRDFSNFEMDEVRVVLKWLTSKDTTALLEVYYDDSNVVSFASIGGFVEPQTYKFANNRTVAITAIWDSVSPFAFSDLYTTTKIISYPTDNVITIDIDTDDNRPVYPRITIKQRGNGVVRVADGTVFNPNSDMIEDTVYFNGSKYYWKSNTPSKLTSATKPAYEGWVVKNVLSKEEILYESNVIYLFASNYYWLDTSYFNVYDKNPGLATTGVRLSNKHTDFFNNESGPFITTVKNNTIDEKIILDGANKIVSSSRTNRIFGEDFDLQWLPLYDGKNEITVEGNCEVTLEWREVRKVGEY